MTNSSRSRLAGRRLDLILRRGLFRLATGDGGRFLFAAPACGLATLIGSAIPGRRSPFRCCRWGWPSPRAKRSASRLATAASRGKSSSAVSGRNAPCGVRTGASESDIAESVSLGDLTLSDYHKSRVVVPTGRPVDLNAALLRRGRLPSHGRNASFTRAGTSLLPR